MAWADLGSGECGDGGGAADGIPGRDGAALSTPVLLLVLNLQALAWLLPIYAALWLTRRLLRGRGARAPAPSRDGPSMQGEGARVGRLYARHHDAIANLYLSFIVYYLGTMFVQTAAFSDGGPRSIFVLLLCVPLVLLWIFTYAMALDRRFYDLYPAAVLVAVHALFGVDLLRPDLRPLLHQLGWPS